MMYAFEITNRGIGVVKTDSQREATSYQRALARCGKFSMREICEGIRRLGEIEGTHGESK